MQVRWKEGDAAMVVMEEFRNCPPADSVTTAPNRAHFVDDLSSSSLHPTTRARLPSYGAV